MIWLIILCSNSQFPSHRITSFLFYIAIEFINGLIITCYIFKLFTSWIYVLLCVWLDKSSLCTNYWSFTIVFILLWFWWIIISWTWSNFRRTVSFFSAHNWMPHCAKQNIIVCKIRSWTRKMINSLCSFLVANRCTRRFYFKFEILWDICPRIWSLILI